MTKLEKAKEVIEKNFTKARCGLFDKRNLVGDPMDNIYDDGELSIDICYGWEYFEVFGLSKEEFTDLFIFYANLGEQNDSREIEKA